MNFKKRLLSGIMSLVLVLGSCPGVVYVAAEEGHTHEHTTLNDTSETSEEPTSHTHKEDAGTVTKQPTCTEAGVKTFKCTSCGETLRTEPIPATGHSYGSWTTVKEATCETDGEKKCICSKCNHSETETIHAKGHTETTERTEPTCGKNGEIKTYCTVCGKVIKSESIPATGIHTWGDWEPVEGPSDCQIGRKETRTCSVCGAVGTRTVEGKHVWEKYSETKATCEKDGQIVYRCKYYDIFSHQAEKTETIPATGHNWEHKVTPKTCTENGKEWDECKNCGAVKNEKVLQAEGHKYDYSKGVVTVEPTCTVGGTKTYTCTECGHKGSLKNIEPLGHDFGAWKVTNPTCTVAGKKERTCSRCKGVETEIIDATGHKVSDWQVKKEATCTEAGIKHKVCLICGTELQTMIYELNPKGHTWTAWQTTKEPTYDTAGEEARTCTRCGLKETHRLPTIAKDHTHKFNGKQSVIKKASCTEDGLSRVYCSHKGCNEYKEITTDALGHAFSEFTTVQEADCINTGVRICECTRCGATQSETTPPLGHKYGEWVTTRESSDTESGLRQRTCEICGDVQVETFLGTPEEVDVNATLPNGTRGVTLTAPDSSNISESQRKSQNRKKAIGVTAITVVLAGVTAGAALLITRKKKKK